MRRLTRRQLIGTAVGAGILWPVSRLANQASEPRLSIQWRSPTASIEPGLHELGLRRDRDGLIFVPPTDQAPGPCPALLMLHGATGSARGIQARFPMAADTGVTLLVPTSAGNTWDGIGGRYGADVAFITRTIEYARDRLNIDRARFGVAGFSDGASYALALGLTNGDLFTHILAFSPGFIPPAGERGRPAIFIAHGTQDTILPIEATSRRIAPQLERRGYRVVYEEFDGPHMVRPEAARKAFDWFTSSPNLASG